MISSMRVWAFCGLTLLAGTGCAGAVDSPNGDETTGSSEDELKARFTSLRKPTDPALASVYAAANKFESPYLGVFRFNKATNEKTDSALREKRIKEVMHRYMCRFFDESIDIGRNTGSNTARAKTVIRDLEPDYYMIDEESKIPALESAFAKAYKNPQLDILSGSASGNNTGGAVVGVYDIAHNEILFFGFTNCGSDS